MAGGKDNVHIWVPPAHFCRQSGAGQVRKTDVGHQDIHPVLFQCRQQHLQIWQHHPRHPGHFRAFQASGHHHIGEQQVDFTAAFDHRKGAGRVGHLQHMVAQFSRGFDHAFADARVNLGHQNGPGSAGDGAKVGHHALVFGQRRLRQIDRDRRSLTKRAVSLHKATRLLDEAITMERSSPVPRPSGLVVTNGSRAFSRMSCAIPVPVSVTDIRTKAWIAPLSGMIDQAILRVPPSLLRDHRAAGNCRRRVSRDIGTVRLTGRTDTVRQVDIALRSHVRQRVRDFPAQHIAVSDKVKIRVIGQHKAMLRPLQKRHKSRGLFVLLFQPDTFVLQFLASPARKTALMI